MYLNEEIKVNSIEHYSSGLMLLYLFSYDEDLTVNFLD